MWEKISVIVSTYHTVMCAEKYWLHPFKMLFNLVKNDLKNIPLTFHLLGNWFCELQPVLHSKEKQRHARLYVTQMISCLKKKHLPSFIQNIPTTFSCYDCQFSGEICLMICPPLLIITVQVKYPPRMFQRFTEYETLEGFSVLYCRSVSSHRCLPCGSAGLLKHSSTSQADWTTCFDLTQQWSSCWCWQLHWFAKFRFWVMLHSLWDDILSVAALLLSPRLPPHRSNPLTATTTPK